MAGEGYEYAEATGEHVYRYREYPPTWWAIYPASNRNFVLAYTVLGAFIGAFIGAELASPLIIPLLIIGFILGLIAGKQRSTSSTKVPLTGKSDPKLNHKIADFMVEWRCRPDGKVSIYREFMAAKADKGWDGSSHFLIADLVTIERQSFADHQPNVMDTMLRNNEKGLNEARLSEARLMEMILLVSRNGQTTDGGWQRSANNAAAVQSRLLEYLGQVRQQIVEQQRRTAQAARIAPDDEAL